MLMGNRQVAPPDAGIYRMSLTFRFNRLPGLMLVAAALLWQPDRIAEAQNEVDAPPDDGALSHLPGIAGDYFRHDSDAVGRGFHIYVSLPQSYRRNPDQVYPVVYVLDGDSLFPIVAPTHQFMTFDYGLPEAVIVGIAYGSFDPGINRRGFDYSMASSVDDENRGGAPAFHAFLKNELTRIVARRYRVDPMRQVLFGQSRGGGMVLYSAYTDPDLFWGRIASNPTFQPGRDLFFSAPAKAARDDLGLVVTSGADDLPPLRNHALDWFAATAEREALPWKLHTLTIPGGRHASFSPSSYREGMLWLFGKDVEKDIEKGD